MTPTEQLKQLEALLLKHTGKLLSDYDSDEDAVASLSFRLNNEVVLTHLLDAVSDVERRAIQMWRQLATPTQIATSTGTSYSWVRQTINQAVGNLRDQHFTKFSVGWFLDETGEPISPPESEVTSSRLAEERFQQWMLVLGLRHD